jgi:hypothetical protein
MSSSWKVANVSITDYLVLDSRAHLLVFGYWSGSPSTLMIFFLDTNVFPCEISNTLFYTKFLQYPFSVVLEIWLRNISKTVSRND